MRKVGLTKGMKPTKKAQALQDEAELLEWHRSLKAPAKETPSSGNVTISPLTQGKHRKEGC